MNENQQFYVMFGGGKARNPVITSSSEEEWKAPRTAIKFASSLSISSTRPVL